MTSTRPIVLAILGVSLVAMSCTAEEPVPTTTSIVPLPPATVVSTTVPASTTRPPPVVEVLGDLPPELARRVGELYSWLLDSRNPPGDLPRGLLDHGADAVLEPPDQVVVVAVTEELPAGEKVAVLHVVPPPPRQTESEDLLFAADEGDGWRIVGARFGDAPPWLGDEPRFLLVLGSDARPGQNQLRFRADSIHVVAVAPTHLAGTIVGFPRDTFVEHEEILEANQSVGFEEDTLPPGGIKWTNLMASRGPEIMLATARLLTDIEIEGYIVTGFVGFEDLIEALGSLVIDLPTTMRTGNDWADFAAGLHNLTPTRALQLARIRKGLRGGDFARSLNQGLIMQAAMAMVQDLGIDAAPRLLRVLLENTWSDVPAGDLLIFAVASMMIAPEDMDNLVLEGSVATIAGASVVLLDREAAAATFADLSDDGLLELVE